MEEQQNWNENYNEYDGYNREWPFTPEHTNMESEQYDNNNDMLGSQAAGNSHMEDTSSLKWEGKHNSKPLVIWAHKQWITTITNMQAPTMNETNKDNSPGKQNKHNNKT